jgi:hypothetical protein
MSSARVTLDLSKAQPIQRTPVTLDLSKAVPITGPGEELNDVGNKVITPIEGESFSDTMKRAAAYGKTVTQSQINAEMRTAPKKVAQTLIAAPAIGLGGTAALAAPGEAAAATPQAIAAIKAMAAAHPIAAKLVSRALEGAAASAGGTAAYKWIKDLL